MADFDAVGPTNSIVSGAFKDDPSCKDSNSPDVVVVVTVVPRIGVGAHVSFFFFS